MELSYPSRLAAQHITLAQGTLLTTVKWPDLICQVGLDVGQEGHDLGPRTPYKHL